MKYVMSVLSLMLLAAAAAAQCSEAEKKALVAFDKHWSETNAKGDRTAIAAIYADEFTAFPAMTGKAAAVDGAVAAAEANKKNPQAVAQNTTDHYMITCTPTTATIMHRNITVQPAANGKGSTSHSRSVHFLEKRNGKWVAVSNAGGPLSDTDILRYMELDAIEAMKTKNADWFENNFASDYREVHFLTGAVMNKQQWIEATRADTTVFDAVEISDLNIRIDGNAAVVTGLGHGRGKSGDGKPFDIKLRFTDVFVKRDGKWLGWSSQATMLPSPPDATARN